MTPREIQRAARADAAIDFETLQRSTEWKIKALKNQIRNLQWCIDNERHPSAYTNAVRARLAQYRAQLAAILLKNQARETVQKTPEQVVRETVAQFLPMLEAQEAKHPSAALRAEIAAIRAALARTTPKN